MSEIYTLDPTHYPELLREIPDMPRTLIYEGELPRPGNKLLAVVGTRKFSDYGRQACESIIWGLKGYPVTIISGLAIGMDGIAHRAALRAGLQTIAIPGSGLDRRVIHPRSHAGLANEIVENGGGLMTELGAAQPAGIWAFPRRNRLMAGMCHATLIIEATLKSGTLITSRLATEYNRDVGAVPGPIDSPTSDGPHMLIRLGAAMIRDHKDVLELLGLDTQEKDKTLFDTADLTSDEETFIKLLAQPLERDELVRRSKMDISQANAVLSLMEIKGLIKEELGEVRKTF